MRVRSLRCPKCGGPARIQHGEQQAACIQCGSPVRLSEALKQEQKRARRFPPQTPLRLGMKASFEGREYEATGRMVLQDLDGSSTWEEWTLVSGDGDLLYLEFDEGKWKVTEPFVPQQPLGPQELACYREGARIRLDGTAAMVTGHGSSQVVHTEGEFPWLVTLQRPVRYLDATAGNLVYCVEWSEDSVEFYRGRFLDARQVYAAFGLRDLLLEIDRREVVLRSRRNFGLVGLAAGLASLVLWSLALSSGTQVANGAGTLRVTQAGEQSVRYGPIQLGSVGRVHRLEIRGALRQQSIWVAAVLEDPSDLEIVSAGREMWDESGYDEGYWHEWDVKGSADFVLRKPGPYYVRLYAEPDAASATSNTAVVSFALKERAIHPTYLAVYGFLAVVLGAIFLMSGSPSGMARLRTKLREAAEDD